MVLTLANRPGTMQHKFLCAITHLVSCTECPPWRGTSVETFDRNGKRPSHSFGRIFPSLLFAQFFAVSVFSVLGEPSDSALCYSIDFYQQLNGGAVWMRYVAIYKCPMNLKKHTHLGLWSSLSDYRSPRSGR